MLTVKAGNLIDLNKKGFYYVEKNNVCFFFYSFSNLCK